MEGAGRRGGCSSREADGVGQESVEGWGEMRRRLERREDGVRMKGEEMERQTGCRWGGGRRLEKIRGRNGRGG